MKYPVIPIPEKRPTTGIICSDEHSIMGKFLDAVSRNHSAAWGYVSRVYDAELDLAELSKIIAGGVRYARFAVHKSDSLPKSNKLIRSVYTTSSAGRRMLLHFHMVKEPDRNGKWKVFMVEKEQC